MNKFHRTSDVYTDAGAAGNLFVKIAKMASDGEEEIELVDTDVACTENPHSGATCIKNSFKALDVNWGGVYFQNGVLFDGDREPRENWGEHPDAGYNLTGATKLTFWARGAKGGEQIEFFAFGVGRNPANDKPIQRYPDSSPKVSRKKNRGYVTLSKEWQQYFLLRPAGAFEQKVTVSRWIVG